MKADAASGTVPPKHTKADFQNRGRVRTVEPPAGAFHEGALTLDLPSGPQLSPEATRREAARGKPPTQTAPSRSSASRRAAVRAQMQRSDLPSQHSADLALAGTASPAAACEVWICPPAHPLAAGAGRALRMPSTRAGRERACTRAPRGRRPTPLSGSYLQPSGGVCGRPQRWRKTGGWDPVGGREEGGKEARHGAQLSRR